MNRAGGVGLIFLGLFVAVSIGAAVLRPSHIERKAVAKCVDDGGELAACKTQVHDMKPSDRLESIRDK